MTRAGEFALIESFRKFQNLSLRITDGIGDDAAVISNAGGKSLLLTTDMLAAGVHFTADTPPRRVGRKALACNISDIAAMGGRPLAAVVSIGLPATLGRRYIRDVYRGLHACAKEFGVSIVGGDTIRCDIFVINIALLGEVASSRIIRRSGARPGDLIFVTGRLGGSLASGRHLMFTPRLRESEFLAGQVRPSAMMDISDGLAGDIRHILRASKVGAELDAAKIPCHRGVTLDQALSDGEDFELLFTLAPARAAAMKKVLARHPEFTFYEVGRITAGPGRLFLIGPDGRRRKLAAKGYEH